MRFNNPLSLFPKKINNLLEIFFCDSGNKSIKKIIIHKNNNTFQYESVTINETLFNPEYIYINNNNIYISDSGDNTIKLLEISDNTSLSKIIYKSFDLAHKQIFSKK